MARRELVDEDLWKALVLWLPPERKDVRSPTVDLESRGSGGHPVCAPAGAEVAGPAPGTGLWRRLRQWQTLGVWAGLHRTLLNGLGDLGRIDWTPASLDSTSVRAKRGGEATGPSPVDRGKAGSKFQLLVDRRGAPLAVLLSAANVHDSKLLEPLVDAIPPIRRPIGQPGRPRFRPAKLHGDKGYDLAFCRDALRRRGIVPRIARRGVDSSERLGRYRWIVERTNAWILAYRRLAVRFDRHAASIVTRDGTPSWPRPQGLVPTAQW